jgi:putative ABC transport system permease protein
VEQTIINIKIAWESIKNNKVRASLTLSIIALGIMALVGILTAIEGLKASINDNFTSLGANSFSVRQSGMGIRRRGGGRDDNKIGPAIKFEQAQQFKDRFNYPATVSISTRASMNATIQNDSYKTNPNVGVMGIDENYFSITAAEIEKGRSFTENEIKSGSNVILLGKDVVKKIFPPNTTVINRYVQLGNSRYMVIGQLKSKGASMNSNSDNQVMVPVLNANRNYVGNENSYTISVMVNDINKMQEAEDETQSLLRNIRRIRIGADNDFEIRKSDAVANQAMEDISFITAAATLIGIITLFGAGIGLMNIMLVLVTERTREIGVSKALGATKSNIRMQFLTEAIVICQIGGFLGIVLGIGAGNLVSLFFDTGFLIPWLWIILGITFCFIVGIAAGIYPAIKASNLDPIDALRYE